MLIRCEGPTKGSAIVECLNQPLPYDPNDWIEVTIGVTAPDTVAGMSTDPIDVETEVWNYMHKGNKLNRVEIICYPRFPGWGFHYATVKTVITINEGMMDKDLGFFYAYQDDNKITI